MDLLIVLTNPRSLPTNSTNPKELGGGRVSNGFWKQECFMCGCLCALAGEIMSGLFPTADVKSICLFSGVCNHV